MKKVLVTGGAGFIGSNFVRFLLDARADLSVVNLDALTYAGSQRNLIGVDESRHTFVHGDIRDRELVSEVVRANDIDTVVHFAAESHVDRSIHEPDLFVQTNVGGTFNLLEAARDSWLPSRRREVRFHHVSTDEVYGSLGSGEPAFTEDHPYAPSSPYAATKAAADHVVRAYHHTYGLPVTISNCSNNYGAFQYPEKLIPLTLLRALEEKEIPIYGDGSQIRDWLHVDDHCAAILEIIEKGRVGRTYNVGGNNQPTNLEVVTAICKIVDELRPGNAQRADLVRFVTDRPGHDRRYAMNIARITGELGWEPRVSLRSGLESTVRWYLDNLDWVASIGRESGLGSWIDTNYGQREKA